MKGPQFMNAPGLYLEVSQTALKALHEERGLDLALDRLPDGRLTDACKTRVIQELRKFLPRKAWQPKVRCYCAIGARGVSLRRLALPAAAKEEFQRVLRMQIESEFPLSPDDLAWGYQSLGETQLNGAARQELLVVAVKKEVVQEYAELFSDCGLQPVFTLAALARGYFGPQPSGNSAFLDVGRAASELIWFENGIPVNVRVLPQGEEQLKSGEAAADALAKAISSSSKKLLISGNVNAVDVPAVLGRRLVGVDCELLKVASGEGRSAAVLGLRKAVEQNGGRLLLLEARQTNGRNGFAQPLPMKLVAAAVGLIVALLLLPYAEAILLKPLVSKKLASIQSQTNRLDVINRELAFLQFLKQSQPPYLDALFLFSKCAPSGSKIESVTMNRRGEVSLRGSLRGADQVSEFRSKLIASGFFYSVAVDEQTPTPDRQKVNIRMTALWKPLAQRLTLAIGPTAEEIEKSKNRKDPAGGPGGMPGGMPPGMPPGMPVMMSDGPPPGARPARPRSSGPPGGPMMSLPPGVELPPGTELPPGFTPGGPDGPVRITPAKKEGNQ
jgi:hypothetical protein